MELAAEEQSAQFKEEALGLVRRSAKRAQDIVSLFRMAYGSAGRSVDFTIAKAEILAEAWLQDSRLQIKRGERIEGGEGRLMLQLVLIAAEIMPRGGTLMFKSGPYLELEGTFGGMLKDLEAFMTGGEISFTAKNIILIFAKEEAHFLRKTLAFKVDGEMKARLGCF